MGADTEAFAQGCRKDVASVEGREGGRTADTQGGSGARASTCMRDRLVTRPGCALLCASPPQQEACLIVCAHLHTHTLVESTSPRKGASKARLSERLAGATSHWKQYSASSTNKGSMFTLHIGLLLGGQGNRD